MLEEQCLPRLLQMLSPSADSSHAGLAFIAARCLRTCVSPGSNSSSSNNSAGPDAELRKMRDLLLGEDWLPRIMHCLTMRGYHDTVTSSERSEEEKQDNAMTIGSPGNSNNGVRGGVHTRAPESKSLSALLVPNTPDKSNGSGNLTANSNNNGTGTAPMLTDSNNSATNRQLQQHQQQPMPLAVRSWSDASDIAQLQPAGTGDGSSQSQSQNRRRVLCETVRLLQALSADTDGRNRIAARISMEDVAAIVSAGQLSACLKLAMFSCSEVKADREELPLAILGLLTVSSLLMPQSIIVRIRCCRSCQPPNPISAAVPR